MWFVLEGALPMSSEWTTNKENSEVSIKINVYTNLIKIFAAIVLTVIGSLLSFGFAKKTDAEGTFEKIYHVYANQQYVGAVSNVEAVNKVLETQENVAETRFKGLDVKAGSNINIVPEHVFNAETDDATTLKKLAQVAEVEVTAQALLIDNRPVAYLKNKEDYEETLRQVKLQFVTEEQLKQWIANQTAKKPLPELQVGEDRIIDITVKQAITEKQVKISPIKVMTPEQAVKLLMTGAIEQQKYVVKQGDVLGSIAKKHDLKIKELLALNPGITEETLLQIDQELNVTVAKPLINVNIVREKKIVEVINNTKIIEEDATMFKGEKVVKQQGSTGKKEASYRITEENGNRLNKELLQETVLVKPVDHIVVVGTKVVSSRGTGDFSWPTIGGYISSMMGNRWGEYHRGIDIARPNNYNILAADNGVVVDTGFDGSYGNKVVVNHNNGYTTLYAHLSEINVSVGQVVPKGAVIGIMGSTGVSTGTHLHFEVEKNGSLVNPVSVLP